MSWLWDQWTYEWQWRTEAFLRNLGWRLRPSTWSQLARRIFVCVVLLLGPLWIMACIAWALLYVLAIVIWVCGLGVLIVLGIVLWPLESLWKLW